MTLDNMTGITKGSYTGGDLFCKSQLITCNRVRECNGVCPFEDALQHADKMQTMNEQHIINHDRDWIIGCIEHDGFIHTHRFDKANQIIHDALSAEASQNLAEPNKELKGSDLIRREDAIDALGEEPPVWYDGDDEIAERNQWRRDKAAIESLPSAEPKTGWIPCSERLPEKEGSYLVCMIWDYCNMDVLMWVDGWNCFRRIDGKVDRESEIDGANIIAWMPLPEPYRKDGEA